MANSWWKPWRRDRNPQEPPQEAAPPTPPSRPSAEPADLARAEQLRGLLIEAGMEPGRASTADELDAVEAAAGVPLPSPYRALLAGIGGGAPCPERTLVPLEYACPDPGRLGLPSPLSPELIRGWAKTVPEDDRYRGLLLLAETDDDGPDGDGRLPVDVVLVVTGEAAGRVVYVDWAGARPLRFFPGDVHDWYETWLRRRLARVPEVEVIGWLPDDAAGLLTVVTAEPSRSATRQVGDDDRLRALGQLGATRPPAAEDLAVLHAFALARRKKDRRVVVAALADLLVRVADGCPVCATPGPCPTALDRARQWLTELTTWDGDPLIRAFETLGVPLPEPTPLPDDARALLEADADPDGVLALIEAWSDRRGGEQVLAVALTSRHPQVVDRALAAADRRVRVPATLYQHADPRTRRAAVLAQAPAALDADLPLLAQLTTREQDVEVRWVWATRVVESRVPGLPDFLRSVLAAETHEKVLAVALHAVGDLRLTALLDDVLRFTTSEEFGLRYIAATTLGDLGDERARAALQRLAAEKPVKTWRAMTIPEVARIALAKLDGTHVPDRPGKL